MDTRTCAKCGTPLPEKADKCPACGETVEEELRCPKCGGGDIIPISGISKAATVVKWGIFSIGKAKAEHRCRDCGHRF